MMWFRSPYSRMSGHTDIRTTGWVARLPQAWRPYALLMRLDRPIGSWLLFLPGLWAFAMVAPDWRQGLWLTALFGLGAVLGIGIWTARWNARRGGHWRPGRCARAMPWCFWR